MKWHDLYRAFSKRLLERGVIDDDTITPADDAALEEIATVLRRRKSFVPAEIGGRYVYKLFPDSGLVKEWKGADNRWKIAAHSRLLGVMLLDGRQNIRLSISLRLLGKRLIWFFSTHRVGTPRLVSSFKLG